jgi:hypothetical protein
MIYPAPTLEYCLQNFNLQWRDVVWGINEGFFTWHDVRTFALHKMSDTQSKTFSVDNEIASLGKNDASQIMDLARDAADCVGPEDVEYERGLWLYLLLKWVFDNPNLFDFPLGAVEEIYSDFGYPESIESFVAFRHPKETWDPAKHSVAGIQAELFRNWATYLEESRFSTQMGSHFEVSNLDRWR